MELSVTYILSQIFTVLMYLFLAISYYTKDRKKILILGILSLITNMIAYVFLNAWSGFSMCVLAFFRNGMFMIDEKKNGKKEYNTKKDVIFLIILYVISIYLGYLTYDGFLSTLSIIATMIFTYSVWQKKSIIYKFCGIPVSILWIIYNWYVESIFGVILESVLLICSFIGFILEWKNKYTIVKESEKDG